MAHFEVACPSIRSNEFKLKMRWHAPPIRSNEFKLFRLIGPLSFIYASKVRDMYTPDDHQFDDHTYVLADVDEQQQSQVSPKASCVRLQLIANSRLFRHGISFDSKRDATLGWVGKREIKTESAGKP